MSSPIAVLPRRAPTSGHASVAAEQAALGAALRNAEAFDRISLRLDADDFTDPACSLIYRAMAAMYDHDRPVDVVTLSALLDRSEKWRAAELGDALAYVHAIDVVSAGLDALDTYLDIIASTSASRALVACARSIEAIAASAESADAKFADASAAVMDLAHAGRLVDSISGAEAAGEALARVLELYEQGGALSGLSSGFEDLDRYTAGLQDADLIVLAARPSMGKTALSMNIACHVAREKPVHVFSLEMSAAQLAQRMLSSLGGVDFGAMRSGKIDHVQQGNLAAASIAMKRLKLRIDDHGGLSIEQIRARARMAARRKPLGLVVVDYLTLISAEGDNQTLRVGNVAKGLKEMAKELNCPVIVLAQLNRGVEQRPNKRPLASDLRDSGEIEQAADLILFNYLDEKYDDTSPRRGVLELIIAKHRNGETGTVYLEWKGEHQKFSTMTKAVPPLKALEGPPAEKGGGKRKRFDGSYEDGF